MHDMRPKDNHVPSGLERCCRISQPNNAFQYISSEKCATKFVNLQPFDLHNSRRFSVCSGLSDLFIMVSASDKGALFGFVIKKTTGLLYEIFMKQTSNWQAADIMLQQRGEGRP